MKLTDEASNRLIACQTIVETLVNGRPVSYQEAKPSSFPTDRGLYVISDRRTGEWLRAGLTKNGLRARLYNNHLMGNQGGNLPAQLVKVGSALTLNAAKQWVRDHCEARWVAETIVIEKGLDLATAEHYLLAALRPKFTDGR